MHISVGAIWIQDLKTPSSAVLPAGLSITRTFPLPPPLPSFHTPQKRKNTNLGGVSTPSLPNLPRSRDCPCTAAGDV